MDKEQPIEETAENSATDDTAVDSYENQEDTAVIETETVVVKKSGGTFSLLLSLVALAAAGYALYLQWQAAENEAGESNRLIATQLQQLEAEQASAVAALQTVQNTNENLRQQSTELATKVSSLERLTQQLQDAGMSGAQLSEEKLFDNSANEVALRQLTLQLQNQEILINQLQSQLNSQVDEPATSQDGVVDQDQLQRALAVKALNQAETLVELHDIETATVVLENFLLATKLDTSWQIKLKQLVDALARTEQPDIQAMQQTLKGLDGAVNQIQLQTETAAAEGNWYDRFVSVKKISDDSSITSSAALVELKLSIKRQLYLAHLMLSLQDQSGWQNSLMQAAELITDNFPEQTQLANEIKTLAQLSLLPKVPKEFDTQALIAQLNGLR
ncbi:hypothetical protein OS175_00690 [Marinicella sp. S1101]|uniref:hypothetical protein n=1 Tax=Marinicella marina TaxID=2996016 RepID=UPI00226085CD|nr:hypothetical protein [Marinicella marina]MCX7552379.1 hypothetical protein [Marinicella marina]MDJ1139254.1 hypothetical protein [Marinicella marina]